ncbi:MAG TPA: type 1 glutamine amidotransferase [Gaiellaceae bacterium]
MYVLALIHGRQGRSGVFGEAVQARGHELEEWSLAWGEPPPRPLDDYGAVLVFGGSMHADQEDRHPWLKEETLFLQRLLDLRTPVFGVCLGAQLLARAAHAPVGPASEPEIGWYDVVLTPEAADDPVLSRLPDRFRAFQWHFYTYGVPTGAVELARSAVCTQAFRLGDAAWAIQFHAEVTRGQIERWLREDDAPGFDRDAIARETAERVEAWNDLGRELCAAFVEAAERVGAPA